MLQPATLVSWALAPAWLTVDQAAALMGPRFPAESIVVLCELGAVDAEESEAGWIIEKTSLRDYRELEVSGHEW